MVDKTLPEWDPLHAPLQFRSEKFRGVLARAARLAPTHRPIVIVGETGTGKKRLAEYIHSLSGRQDQPFEVWSVPGTPEDTIHSYLFGHVKGSFSGATDDRLGLIRAAGAGTVLVDDLQLAGFFVQSVLYRFMDDRSFKPLGSDVLYVSSARILVASNVELSRLVRMGKLMEDLAARFGSLLIEIPPFRERPEDILCLVQYYVEQFAPLLELPVPDIDPAALKLLQGQPWPGNARDIGAVVQNALDLSRGSRIEVAHVLEALRLLRGTSSSDDQLQAIRTLPRGERLAPQNVRTAFSLAGGSTTKTAEVLGVSKSTTRRLLKKSTPPPQSLSE